MMNWCSKHECFEICPECMRELQATKPVAQEIKKRDPEGCGCSINSRNYGTYHDKGCDHLMADY